MNNKVILITGANSNIGSKLVEHFLEEGYVLLLLHHKKQEHIQHLLKMEDSIYSSYCDLTKWEESQEAVQKLVSESNQIPYALIHTATIRSDDSLPVVDSDPLKWANVINTNVISAYHALKAVLPYMISQKKGRIVLFGSEVSRNGLANGSAYSASKSAISNLCRSLALELKDSGILVNTLSPGPVETDDSQFDPQYREFRKKYFEKQIQNIPLHRVIQIEDIIPLCSFLISEQNTYLTGEEIFLTGGKF